MAKKTNKKQTPDFNLAELGQEAGLVLLQDSDYAVISDRLPLFLPRIDKVLGGGFPFGRMVEIAGKPSGGKSTVTFHAARVATQLGCIVVLIDVEGTADRDRLAHLGIDTSKVLVKQPDPESGVKLTVEEVGRTVETTLQTFKERYPDIPVVFIWDSVGGTPSEDELAKDFGDKNVGARAKAITQFITKTAPQISQTKSLLLGINQVRDDIGGNPMFPSYKVPGGMAWEHFASIRLEIQKKQTIKKGTDKIGHIMGVHVRKSKVSRPFQIADGYLISDNGIDYEYNLVEMAKDAKIVQAVGQSFQYVDNNGEIHKQKRDNFIEWLRTEEGHEVREEILNHLIAVEFPDGYTALTNENLDISGWMDAVTVTGLTPLNELPEGTDPADADSILKEVQDEIKSEKG
ncbi:recombinase [Bacillus phage Mater]|uniref:Recombinase n=1 Tax=Bacillus phage Mater TaxID=1540090 RepID=A0A0A0RMI2_9CAUD|nr:UvsX-like recombinase [Bacillus phage Mater]AIW03270.1 recombinase [Bacillus phage Mater]